MEHKFEPYQFDNRICAICGEFDMTHQQEHNKELATTAYLLSRHHTCLQCEHSNVSCAERLPGLKFALELVQQRQQQNLRVTECSEFSMIDEIQENLYIESLLYAEINRIENS